ncbi:MAG: FHA domain-containing protein [Anaerolineales bacterium]|nr:FHA domain-containing protein [Anaerolineales bacterium]
MERSIEELPVLIAQTGPLNGQRWPISGELIVGRDADCEVVVADRQVSRQHARFTVTEEGVTLEDLGSKNGTHYNGQQIEEKVLLQDGDVVQVALAQQFVFLSSDATVPLTLEETAGMPLKQGRLRLDHRSRRVWVGKSEIIPPLSVAQYTLLEKLYHQGGRVVSREDLIEAVWGEESIYEVSNQALDALVRRLRDRLAEVDNAHEYVVTVRGHGLRLENPT